MPFRSLKYLLPMSFYALAWMAFYRTGIWAWAPMLYAWLCIPLLELLITPDSRNLSAAEEDLARRNPLYDLLLYLIVPVQFVTLFGFLHVISTDPADAWTTVGRICTMGMLCGTFGINVGHELGHRIARHEILMAKALLSTSLYQHFYIEHNKGHHKHVATPEDPSSARLHEPVYRFWIRSIVFSYLSAWRIANRETRKKKGMWLHPANEMIQAHLTQAALLLAIAAGFGLTACLAFLGAAFMGILLLETVNYIEHYGLSRKKSSTGGYERAMPAHSWNSNHPIGRMMLFELSRHSDHHYLASRKYQILEHHPDAPQLPTGYPGSMLLALLPPLWFRVMDARIRRISA